MARSATRAAWLDTFTMAPPTPDLIMAAAAYLITSRAPRVLIATTWSNTPRSASVAGSTPPPHPAQLTKPHTSRSVKASRMLSSDVEVEGEDPDVAPGLQLGQRRGRTVTGDDIGTGSHQPPHDGPADAARGPGDQTRAAR